MQSIPPRYAIEAMEPRVLLSDTSQAIQRFNTSPAVFVENVGQWADPSVRFVHQGKGATIALTDTGPNFDLYRSADTPLAPSPAPGFDPFDREPKQIESTQFSVRFDGANLTHPVGSDRSSSYFNYFIGDESRWRTNVAGFETITYPQLWDGIDLVTWGRRSHLKYEFHVAPGADYRQIQISYDAIEGLSLDDEGRLHVSTKLDEVIDDAPYVYQEINGKRVEVASRFVLFDADTYAFQMTGRIDPNQPVVIDPQLAWGSYLGGTEWDRAYGIATDGVGNAWVTGVTGSLDFPTGGFDPTYNGGDAFVAKINANGTLAWGSYLGGSGGEYGQAIALDESGNAWVTGITNSIDFPGGGFDPTYNGDSNDAFVAKVNANGSFAWGSYLGGSNGDYGYGVAIDPSGNAWVTGVTTSSDFPGGGFDPTYNGNVDGFMAKVNADGSFAWASYVGGSSVDNALGIAIDGLGNAWVVGDTQSTNFPGGGFDPSYSGNVDAFVAKVNANGTFAWGSYLGGSGHEYGSHIAVDGSANAYVTGQTSSTDFPGGGFDPTYNGGQHDAFVAKVKADGMFAWGSFLGGSEYDWGQSIAVDDSGITWVTGQTSSTDFPGGGFDLTYNGGQYDAFVAKINANDTLAWGSYLGGSDYDVGHGVAIDGSGYAWVAGYTFSDDFPGGGFDPTYNGSDDAFVAKVLDLRAPSAPDLDPASDTGVSDTDNMTADNAPTFSGTAQAGTTVRIFADGVEVGIAAAPDGLYSITTSPLADGVREITATATDSGGNVSLHSNPLLVTIDTVAPATPPAPDLDPASDSGLSNSDDITNDNTPTLGIFSTDAYWRLLRDGAQISGDYESSGTFTDGTLGDGVHTYTMRAVDAAGNVSAESDALAVTIDTAGPQLSGGEFLFATAPHRVRFAADDDISATLTREDVTVANLTLGVTISTSSMALAYEPGLDRATITFPGLPSSLLLDGRYRLSVEAPAVSDVAGNALASDFHFEFFFLRGDANHDARVNLDDFNILAANFGQSPRDFTQGDFNYRGLARTCRWMLSASGRARTLARARVLTRRCWRT